MTTVQVVGLRVHYGDKEVLKGVDLEFEPGRITAIIGPSGCGKTTLLSTLNRLSELSPDCRVAGGVFVDNQNVLDMDAVLLRRRVGMVFQSPNPFPMSIRDNVLYGVRASNLRVNENYVVQASLTRAALWDEVRDRLSDHAFGLSVGQQQRLCLARCLAISPAVILMDEPTASLDPTSSARIEESILALRGEYTVIIVTHNMQQARRLSAYIAFLYQGQLVEFGETERFFTRPWRDLSWQYINGSLA
jgi:phosphate transport system ATP-binding protein